MRPVDPPTTVYHLEYGYRVVVNIDDPDANTKAEQLAARFGIGTWTISLEAQLTAIDQMNMFGQSSVSENPIWIPWSDLSIPAEG